MTPTQSMETVTVATLLDKVRELREQGYRLVQISTTRLPDQVEFTYSFDRETRLVNLRLSLPPVETRLPSISSIFGCAILYENEIHDLFGVTVDGLTVDFKGNFYKTAVKFPFGSTKAPCASAAATAGSPPGAPATPAGQKP